jgi:hypothetical protein
MPRTRRTPEERRARFARALSSATLPSLTVIEAPRTERERRLDPATTLRRKGGGRTITLEEADPTRVDPNTSRLFSREEIRRSLNLPIPTGLIKTGTGRQLKGSLPVQLLRRRLGQLALAGGTVGQLVAGEERGLPIFGRATARRVRGTRVPVTDRRFPFHEQSPTQSTFVPVSQRLRRGLSSTRSL